MCGSGGELLKWGWGSLSRASDTFASISPELGSGSRLIDQLWPPCGLFSCIISSTGLLIHHGPVGLDVGLDVGMSSFSFEGS